MRKLITGKQKSAWPIEDRLWMSKFSQLFSAVFSAYLAISPSLAALKALPIGSYAYFGETPPIHGDVQREIQAQRKKRKKKPWFAPAPWPWAVLIMHQAVVPWAAPSSSGAVGGLMPRGSTPILFWRSWPSLSESVPNNVVENDTRAYDYTIVTGLWTARRC